MHKLKLQVGPKEESKFFEALLNEKAEKFIIHFNRRM